MRTSLGRRLLAVALLGAITCGVCVFGVGRVVSLANKQRLERAREITAAEVARVAEGKREPGTRIVGLRAGVATSFDTLGDLAPGERESVREAIAGAATATGFGEREASEVTYLAAAKRIDAEHVAWVEYAVHPPAFLRFWQIVVTALSAATLLLVATATATVASTRRGARELKAALRSLATDLGAPVPRPAVKELSEIADGVAALAEDLARTQQERDRLGRELADEKRLAALGRVAAGVAHEVRNPLAAMKLRLDLLATDVPGETARELDAIGGEIVRLDRLVADLLLLAGPRRDRRVTTPLGSLVRERIDFLAKWSEERGVAIEASGEAEVSVDPDAVARAVDNVLKNAIEASPEGARVAIVVGEDDERAVIRVRDAGPGVPTDKVPMLFEPFFTTKPGGTGLGLALSRAIAKAQGGDLVYRREAERTCFELSFARGAA